MSQVGELLGEAAAVVLPHEVVHAVVEVVELQVLQLGLDGAEQLLDALDVFVHGAAHIHQQQHLHVVVALGHHPDVQPAGVGGGGSDGVGQIQLQVVPLARELAQAPQRDLDVARAQLLRVVVVLVGALVPHLHGALVLAGAADADALRVVAAVAEGAGAAGADPLVAAFVALLLLFQAFLERFHQLVPAHLLDGGLLLGRQLFLEHLAQPVGGDFLGEVGQHLDALEVGGEGAVELVEVLLVLDQRGAGQVIEVVDRAGVGLARADHVGLQRLQQRQELLDRDRQLGGAQGIEEIDEHGGNLRWAPRHGGRAGTEAVRAPRATHRPSCCT